jgi:hypothetical protein
MIPPPPLKLNLGSGQNPQAGYLNVDKFGSPDMKWDLEVFPWPWADDSVDEILMIHVFEHLGQAVGTYFQIIKEIYRVCRHTALIHIIVPHPCHDDFLSDPTHVRSFTPYSFEFFSQARNRKWQAEKNPDSPLGIYLGVDLVSELIQVDLDEPWLSQSQAGKISDAQVRQAVSQLRNVAKQIQFKLRVSKNPAPAAIGD